MIRSSNSSSSSTIPSKILHFNKFLINQLWILKYLRPKWENHQWLLNINMNKIKVNSKEAFSKWTWTSNKTQLKRVEGPLSLRNTSFPSIPQRKTKAKSLPTQFSSKDLSHFTLEQSLTNTILLPPIFQTSTIHPLRTIGTSTNSNNLMECTVTTKEADLISTILRNSTSRIHHL